MTVTSKSLTEVLWLCFHKFAEWQITKLLTCDFRVSDFKRKLEKNEKGVETTSQCRN